MSDKEKPVFATKEEEIEYLAANMTQEEAMAILAPYLTRPDTKEVDREVARRISEARSETDKMVSEAESLTKGPGKTPTRQGPVFCRRCKRHAFTLSLRDGVKVIGHNGQVMIDFGADVKMMGNSFNFKCPFCDHSVDITI